MADPARWFIGVATTEYRPESGFDNHPELEGELERMAVAFENLGYRRVPGFGLNLDRRAFEGRLRGFLRSDERRPDDVVVVYYTGHGSIEDGVLRLPTADTTDDVAFSAMPASDLTGSVLSGRTAVQHLLYIIDTCYAAAAGRDLVGGAIDYVNRIRHPDASPTVGVVVAARPGERAGSGAFTRAFVDAVNHPSSGGAELKFLPLDGLVHIVNDTTPAWQHARLYLTGDGITELIPNPRFERWLLNVDEREQARTHLRRRQRTERWDHVLPRAAGGDAPSAGELPWLFTGRERALRAVCAWLHLPSGPATMIVTGEPGSGKSALLARLYVLSRPELRNRVAGVHALAADTIPPTESIARFIHARGRTSDELMAELCDACGVEQTMSPGRFLASIAHRSRPIVVIIDSIDEAVTRASGHADGEFPIVDQVLGPLVRAVGRTPLRLLIGTRSNLVPVLNDGAELIDLDGADYADRESVRRYAKACLLELSDDSPYRGQPAAYVESVADAVAAAAGHSFLVALMTARSLALLPVLPDPEDRAWRAGLPREAADAMRSDLDLRLGDQAAKARELLLPLAYAYGSGLPWEDLWPRLARALGSAAYTSGDIDWLIEKAGFYIAESTSEDGRRSTYHLFHEALAAHLRSTRADQKVDRTIIADALVRHVPEAPDGSRDWSHAHPYIAANLASHAVGTGLLDDLVQDPRFLLAVGRSPLLAALPATIGTRARAAADAYRRADSRLQTYPGNARAAYLELVARCARAPHLAEAIGTAALPRAFTTAWASWRLQPPHRILRGHQDWVNTVALGQVNGSAVVVSGGFDRTVRVWDPLNGQLIGTPFAGHFGFVNAVAIGRLADRAVVVSGDESGAVYVWDAATGESVGPGFIGHTAPVHAVAIGRVDGRTAVVSGGSDHTVQIWDAHTAELICEPYLGHMGAVRSVAIGVVNGRSVVVSAGDIVNVAARRGIAAIVTVHVWDALTGEPIGPGYARHTGSVLAAAFTSVNGRPVVVSAGYDETVHVWDAVTAEPIGEPFTGHVGSIRAVAVGRIDGRTVVVSGGGDWTVRVWHPGTGEPIGTPYSGHRAPVRSVAIGHVDGRSVIVSSAEDRTVRVWDASFFPLVDDPYTGHTASVRALAVGEVDGVPVVVSGGNDRSVRLWDAATGLPIGTPLRDVSGVNAVAIGTVGGRPIVAWGTGDGTVRTRDASTGDRIGMVYTGHTQAVSAVAVANVAGHAAVVSGSADGSVHVRNVVTGDLLTYPVTRHVGPVNALAVHEVGDRVIVVSGGHDATVHIWDALTGQPLAPSYAEHASSINALAIGIIDGRPVVVSGARTVRVWDLMTGDPVRPPYEGHAGAVRALALGVVDDHMIVLSCGGDGRVHVWDASTTDASAGADIGRLASVEAAAVVQLPSGAVLVGGAPDGTMQAWEPSTGHLFRSIYAGHTSRVSSVAIGRSAGRPVVVSGSDDQTVRVWDAADGRLIGDPHTGHNKGVTAVGIGEINRRQVIVSGSDDATVRVTDLDTGEPVGTPYAEHVGAVNAIATGHMGVRMVVASGGDEHLVRVWDLETGAPVGPAYLGHGGPVRAIALADLEGRIVVVSGADDETVQVWNPVTGLRAGAVYHGHRSSVRAVAVGDVDGRVVVVSGSDDATVHVWNPVTGQPGAVYTGHGAGVRAVALGEMDGRVVVASGADDGTVHVWDPNRYDEPALRVIDLAANPLAVVFAESGHVIVAAELGIVAIRLREVR